MSATGAVRVRVGFRHVIRVHAGLDADGVRGLQDEFWNAVEDGAREIWVDVSHLRSLGTGGQLALERMNVAAHELDRDLVMIAGEGAVARAVGSMPELTAYPDVSAAHYGC